MTPAYLAALESLNQLAARVDITPEDFDASTQEEIRRLEASLARRSGFCGPRFAPRLRWTPGHDPDRCPHISRSAAQPFR